LVLDNVHKKGPSNNTYCFRFIYQRKGRLGEKRNVMQKRGRVQKVCPGSTLINRAGIESAPVKP